MGFFANFLRPAPEDPSNEDEQALWHLLTAQYVSLNQTREREPFLNAFLSGTGGEAAFERHNALLKEHVAVQGTLERLPAPPHPPFPVFRLSSFAGSPVTGVMLTCEAWAVLFVGMLYQAKTAFASTGVEHDYGKVQGAPRLLLLLLAKRAAELGGWRAHQDLETDWRAIKKHYRRLVNVGRAPEHRLPE